MLCRNKHKLIPNSHPGVYTLKKIHAAQYTIEKQRRNPLSDH